MQHFKDKTIWFTTEPLGQNKPNSMVRCMMNESGARGHFTNHSLQATAVARLFQEGVDEKLIQGATGHRSEALNSYKRDKKHVEASEIVLRF